jgi:hypothetical protein
MRFHDGEHFPEEAKAVQCIDVRAYTSTVRGFWTSKQTTGRAQELQDQLKLLACSVASMVRSVPRFEPDWPVFNAPGIEPGRIQLARL